MFSPSLSGCIIFMSKEIEQETVSTSVSNESDLSLSCLRLFREAHLIFIFILNM